MPSWNIHIHHAEEALHSPVGQRVVHDADAFIIGNVAPDIYVGWIVPDCTQKIRYHLTHFTDRHIIPLPRFWEFWDQVALPSADKDGRVSDVVLGAWAHLAADHVYNHDFRDYIDSVGIAINDVVRKQKQADYDLFGTSILVSSIPHATPDALAQCAAFPQYAIEKPDVYGTIRAIQKQIGRCPDGCIDNANDYHLLSHDFLETSRRHACDLIQKGLKAYDAHGAYGIGRIRGYNNEQV